MSNTYSIGCAQCKVSLWIAQAPGGDRYAGHLYANKSKELYKFLQDHLGHPLVFDNDVEGESDLPQWNELDDNADSEPEFSG